MSAFIGLNILENPRLPALALDALSKSFVVLAFAAALCFTWRRAAAATRHLIWFFGIAGLLLLPLLPFVLPAAHKPLWSVSGGLISGNEIALSLELARSKPVAESNHASPTEPLPSSANGNARQIFNAHVSRNWLAIGFDAWALGAMLALLYPIVGRIQLARMAANASSLATFEWTELLAEASRMLGLRRRVVLLQSPASVMPLTWGWLRPKVLLPIEADRWPAERRRIVLLHELAHVKRRDCLTQSITRVVCALYWFNPLAWIAARQMRVERERACDDLVLTGGCKASDYAGHLVEIATTFRRAPQAAGIAMARSSNLEQRVTAIVDASRARRLRPAGMVGILISIGAVIFYIGGYKTNAAADDKSSTVNQETLAQIEKFAVQKEEQSKMLAAASGERILPQFQKYFDAAKNGDYRTVTNMYEDFKKYHPQYAKNPRLGYRTSYWQPMLELSLVYDHFANCDPKFTQQAVRDIIDCIRPGSIYLGGTDPGRGLPTAFSKSHADADPFYTISQNPLADSSYEEYLRQMYGEKRRTLAPVAAARQADPELSKLDQQFQAAEQKALTFEMSKPDNDPARLAADKAVEDLSSNIDQALARVEKSIDTNENSAAANSWSREKVIYVPTPDDVQKAFADYSEDAKKRKEEKKLKPGEEVKVDANGQVQVAGQVAVQGINARISKLIFDKNPNHEFYVEESFPHDWMYPYLEPNGLIMKIDREPLAELPDDILQKDQDYWQTRVNAWLGNWLTPETPVATVADFATKVYARKDLSGFSGDVGFIQDNYAPKMFSKWRSSIAGIYAWRLGVGPAELPPEYAAKNDAEKQKLTQAADFAYKQAFALCPSSPEAVFSYVNFLTKSGRKLDALLVAQAAAKIDPSNEIFGAVVKSLSADLNSLPAESPVAASAQDSDRLKQLEVLRVQKEAEYIQQNTLFEKLKTLNRDDLRRALPIVEHDDQLNHLLDEYNLAQQKLLQLKINYTPDHPAYQSAEAAVKELDHKIDDRMEGIMVGLESKLKSADSYLAVLRKDLEEARAASQGAR